MSKGKFKILVSDPWNYDGPQGPNLIIGNVVKILNEKCLVFQSEDDLNFDKYQGKIMILSPRYVGQTFDSKGNYDITVHGGLLLSSFDENKDAKTLFEESKYVIIGSLEQLSLLEKLKRLI